MSKRQTLGRDWFVDMLVEVLVIEQRPITAVWSSASDLMYWGWPVLSKHLPCHRASRNVSRSYAGTLGNQYPSSMPRSSFGSRSSPEDSPFRRVFPRVSIIRNESALRLPIYAVTTSTPRRPKALTMDASTTLLDSKAAFLRAQVRLLSQPLQPSRSWRDFAPETSQPALPNKTIDAVMLRVNEKLKQHNKAVYSAPSQRHVAEQLDALYWNEIQADEGQANADALAVRRDADLTDGSAVEGLPEELKELAVHDGQVLRGEDAERYAVLREKLVQASRRRDQQRKRLEGHRRLKELLEPLEDAQENVQPNLVTRDGELGKELDRMRVLLARLTGKVGEVQARNKDGRSSGEVGSDKQRLQAAMDLT